MIKEKLLLGLLAVLFCFSSLLRANPLYGQASLKGLQGIEVFVHCAGDFEVKKMEHEIKTRLKARLEYAKVPMVVYNAPNDINGEISSGGGALKLLLTGFKKKEGDYFIYASLQLHQRAYLAISQEYMDCPTWDAWRIGVFNEKEIFSELEDMVREFANDFISANEF